MYAMARRYSATRTGLRGNRGAAAETSTVKNRQSTNSVQTGQKDPAASVPARSPWRRWRGLTPKRGNSPAIVVDSRISALVSFLALSKGTPVLVFFGSLGEMPCITHIGHRLAVL